MRDIDIAALGLIFAGVAAREIDGIAIGRERRFTLVGSGIDNAILLEEVRCFGPAAVTVLEDIVEIGESLARPSVDTLVLLVVGEARRGENQLIGIVTDKARGPIVVLGIPIVESFDDMARAVGKKLADERERVLAGEGIVIVGDEFEISVVVGGGVLEFILEAVHFGEVEIDFRLGLVIAGTDQARVDPFRLREIVHQTVAFAGLEIDTVFFHLVRFHLIVSRLIFLQRFDILFLFEELVGFLRHIFVLSDSRESQKNGQEEE